MELIKDLLSKTQLNLVLVLSLIGVAVIVVLVMYIFHLKSRLNDFENPRYGFLGKSIYPMIGFIGMGMIIVFAVFGVASPDTDSTQAEFQIDGRIQAEVISQTLNSVNVQFYFEPRVSGIPWGDINDTFDIYWHISGPTRTTKTEMKTSKFNMSGFSTELRKGEYTIEIVLVYQEETFTFVDTLSY